MVIFVVVCDFFCGIEETGNLYFFQNLHLLSFPTIYSLKVWIYEIHIFELRNEEINVKKILAVINATYAVAKRNMQFAMFSFKMARIRIFFPEDTREGPE